MADNTEPPKSSKMDKSQVLSGDKKKDSTERAPYTVKDVQRGIVQSAAEHLRAGQTALKDGLQFKAKENLLMGLYYGQSFMETPEPEEQLKLELAETLVQLGVNLNMLMLAENAAFAFSTSLQLLNCGPSTEPRVALLFCRAFSALARTHLHINNCFMASSVISQCATMLEGSECNELIQQCHGELLMELGLAEVENTMCSSAIEPLKNALALLQLHSSRNIQNIAKVLSSLGYCYLCNRDEQASRTLEEALRLWKILKYPLEESNFIVNTMKHLVESHFCEKSFHKDRSICKELLQLHKRLHAISDDMQVADAFTYLGTVAFHKENERKACSYFEQALSLYRQAPSNPENKEDIRKLLRFIGVASYNCREFHRAAQSYLECLNLLEQQASRTVGNVSKIGQIAECCASLGFTYSRLRDFDNMLKYYERALQLGNRLAREDLELIETNIGSLYHVKAVKCEQSGLMEQAKKFYELAEGAFSRALRYSWKSFPYINYGYYLLCRARYDEAATTLQQGYLNGVIDKDTVEFDHTEDPILIDDLKMELEGQEDIRMPSTIIALYLKTLSHAKMGNSIGAKQTVNQLEQETTTCKFEAYYVEGYGQDRMKALSYSLLGYAFKAASLHHCALQAFETAIMTLPGYRAAQQNLRSYKVPKK